MSRTGAVVVSLWKRICLQRWSRQAVSCLGVGLVLSVLLPVAAAGQDLLVDEAISQWDYGGGFAAWSLDCDVDGPGYLRRLSALATRPQTLEETPRNCGRNWHWGLTVDASGLYYYAPNRRQILHRPPDRGDLEEVIVQLSNNREPRFPVQMETNATHLYWAGNNRIFRAGKQGEPMQSVVGTQQPNALVVQDSDLYWLDRRGLWHLDTVCVGTPTRCNPRQLTSEPGQHLWLGEGHLYWVSPNPNRLRIRRLQLPRGRAQTVHEVDSRVWRLSQPVANQTHLFWKEHRLDSQARGRIMRLPLNRMNQQPTEIAGGLTSAGTKMAIDALGIYFSGQDRKLFRLRLDAPAVNRDLQAVAMEVTQGIQNFDNDVQLSAKKKTFVRLFGQLNSGPAAYAVDASLRGTRNGNPLPGSPLRPLNGPFVMRQGDPLLRRQLDGGWLFELPNEWITAGRIQLEGMVDAPLRYPDNRRNNNRITENLLFKDHPPTCAVFVPIRGHGPRARNDNAPFRSARSRATRLLPSPSFRSFTHSSQLEELETCWWKGFLPYPCWGPYEMGGDPDKVIFALALRAAHTDDPDSCQDQGAWVQYVGMVHNEVFSHSAGKGNFCRPWSWFKLPSSTATPSGPAWTWPRHGATLAHELSHNFERYHVPCGDPSEVDDNYPYPVCQLDCLPGDAGCPADLADNPGRIHFGFDTGSQTIIAPDDAGDLMSYSHSSDLQRPRWTSDYTWNEVAIKQRSEGPEPFSCIADFIFDQTGPASQRPQPRASQDRQTSGATVISKPSAQGTKPEVIQPQPLPKPPLKPTSTTKPDLFHLDDLSRAPRALLIGGSISPRRGESTLHPAWIRNTTALGKSMMRRWQRQVTPPFKPGDKALGHWRLRVHATDGRLMADRAVLPMGAGDLDADPDAKRYFLLAAPLPLRPVGHIELWAKDRKVARLEAGKAPPQARILSPQGGERFDQSFTVRWRAEDKDPNDILMFTVQYSPDGGKTWQAVVSDMPGHPEKKQHSIEVRGVPGSSSQALVRLLVTDGLHTREATSRAFAVRNQAPSAYIDWPQDGVETPAGRPVTLRGGADDPELGHVPPKGLSWSLDGEAVGGGDAVRLSGGMAPGTYEVELLARDPQGNGDRARQTLRIAPLSVPLRSGMELDGLCGDAAYSNAAVVRLAPYDGAAGTDQASVRAVHHRNHLWLCFHDLLRTPRIAGRPSVSRVGIRLDVEGDGGPRLSHHDVGFFVREDGIPVSRRTGRDQRLSTPGPSGVEARVHRHGSRRWSAELRIDLTDRMPRKNQLRLVLRHENAGPGGRGSVAWPYEAQGLQPASWADIRLDRLRLGSAIGGIIKPPPRRLPGPPATLPGGLAPLRLDALVPSSAPADSGPKTVEVRGRGFRQGMSVLWNGETRPTRFISPTRLVVQLSADDFQWGRRVGVTVSAGEGAAPEPLFFDVERKKGTASRR